MRYRALKEGNLYYPQVKETKISKIISNPLWWLYWKRIGDHRSLGGNPFGLYEELNYGYKTEQEANEIIELYKKSIR